jgi:hypothetical protein
MAMIKLHTPTCMQDYETITEFDANDIRHIVSVVGNDEEQGTHFYLKGISEKQFCLEPAKQVKQMVADNKDPKPSLGAPHIHIGSIGDFTGNLGSTVSAHNLQIGNFSFSGINEQLKQAGVSQQERNELENIMDQLESAKSEDKPSLLQRGMTWINRNKSTLGALGEILLSWFKHHGN